MNLIRTNFRTNLTFLKMVFKFFSEETLLPKQNSGELQREVDQIIHVSFSSTISVSLSHVGHVSILMF